MTREKTGARILDGYAVAQQTWAETERKVAVFRDKWGVQPTLALVRAGEHPASIARTCTIRRTCKERGIAFQAHVHPADVSEDLMVELVRDRWIGDVDFDAVKEVAGAITPVPGGTDVMANEMLVRNVLTAALRQCRFGVEQASRVVPVRSRAITGTPAL